MKQINVLLFLSALTGLVFIVLMTLRYQKLSDQYLRVQSEFLEKSAVRTGDALPLFDLEDLRGEPALVDFSERALSLVQVISTTCAASSVQRREWWPQVVADEMLHGLAPTLISIEGAEASRPRLASAEHGGRILATGDPFFRRAFRVNSVPVLLLVDRQGTVLWSYNGIMDDTVLQELRDTVAESRAMIAASASVSL